MPPLSTPFSALRALSRLSRPSPSPFAPLPRLSRFVPIQTRFSPSRLSSSPYSTTSSHPHPPTSNTSSSSTRKPHGPPPAQKEQTAPPPKPEYEMTFTCTPCSTRSTHRVSKQGYHHGSVLITCPECRNRHVISDHLNIFGDKHMTIEDLMREQGKLVKKGTLSEDGNLEFWADGTTTDRAKPVRKGGDVTKGVE